MKQTSVSQLPDHELVRHTHVLVAEGRANTAALLTHLAEIEGRRLYARRYSSMHDWCIGELHFSRDAAYRRIRAAHAARGFPELLVAIADGRLHLTAVGLLGPHLTPGNVGELIEAATHQGREAIEMLLAHRFPQADVPTELRLVSSAPGTGASPAAPTVMAESGKVAPAPLAPVGAPNVAPPATPYLQTKPISPERYSLKATLDEETVDLLKRAQALLGHTLPSGELVQVLKRVLQDWVQATERRKFGLTEKPRARRSAANGRYIPAQVKRAVFKRDGGRCTFVGHDNRRCGALKFLEFDHIIAVAKGGLTTTDNLRLRCRRHNQVEADRVFGAGFMERKRQQRSDRPFVQARGNTIQDAPARVPPA